jgi:hypothetical protein
MEFSGVIEYNSIFILNFFYGVTLSVIHLFVSNLFIRQKVVRYIVSTYIVLFFFPMFILDEWVVDFLFLEVFIYVELFFWGTLLFYNFLFYVFKVNIYKKELAVRTLKITGVNPTFKKNSIINFLFYIFSAGFVFYFLENLGFSGVYQYIYLQEVHPRFAWYESPTSAQFLFAIYGRILAPMAIILQKNNLSFIVVVLLSVLVLMNSVERQTMIIIIFSLLVRLFFIELNFKQKVVNLAMIVFLTMILIYIFIMQGNIESHISSQTFFYSTSVIFNRIIVDPLYMLHHIITNYSDIPYTYATTSRSIGYIFGVYTSGFSAIGILADGYLSLGFFGVLLTSFWYSMILAFCSLYLNKMHCVPNIYKTIAIMLMSIMAISFFYSNIFSAIPLAILLIFAFYSNFIIRRFKC